MRRPRQPAGPPTQQRTTTQDHIRSTQTISDHIISDACRTISEELQIMPRRSIPPPSPANARHKLDPRQTDNSTAHAGDVSLSPAADNRCTPDHIRRITKGRAMSRRRIPASPSAHARHKPDSRRSVHPTAHNRCNGLNRAQASTRHSINTRSRWHREKKVRSQRRIVTPVRPTVTPGSAQTSI